MNDLNMGNLIKIWLQLWMQFFSCLDSDTSEVELDMCFCQAQAASTSNTSPIEDASPEKDAKDTVETQAPPLGSQKMLDLELQIFAMFERWKLIRRF